ncbi:MAG: hypothetical protein RI554_06300 [Trueperaceae bacterium]|nr:hypothetical protein [Trueperaceae bacterium]
MMRRFTNALARFVAGGALVLLLAGCGLLGGGGGTASAPEQGTVTLCSATVPEPDAAEEVCQEVAFAYEAPAAD